MSPGVARLLSVLKRFADFQFTILSKRYGRQITEIFEFPINVVLTPFTLPFEIAGSAQRGFGVPEFISKLSYSAIFAVATLGTCDIALELGKKFVCTSDCRICNGWKALQCTMCKGSGMVQYQVKDCHLQNGEKPTVECIANAIAENRAELVHFPSTVDLPVPLPFKDCPTCSGSGSMICPECKDMPAIKLSTDNIVEPPWIPFNIMKKIDYPYEHIVDSMKDPSIAAFWLITLPQVVGGFEYDDDVKRKIWWQYKESMRYDQVRDEVAKRKPGWEYLQEALMSIDPVRARDDPVVIKNIPYYRAKKVLEAEVMKFDPPPRPQNWGELNLPLSSSSWSEEDLKDPTRFYEMTVLLNAQREIAEQMLDAQWEAKWREEKLNKLLEEKVRPYLQNVDNGVLSPPIVIKNEAQKKPHRQRRWWIF